MNDQAELVSHLKGVKSIMNVFGVSRRTVVAWRAKGAPIYLVGKRLQASYRELWRWIGANSRAA